jgi:hypothetical protein
MVFLIFAVPSPFPGIVCWLFLYPIISYFARYYLSVFGNARPK